MLIELHALTSHPPANLNRDDLGRPKEAVFGGVRRARISSQSLKRAIRLSPYLASRLDGALSTRSQRIVERLHDELKEEVGEDRAERLQQASEALVKALGKSDSKHPLRTKQIVFMTAGEIGRTRSYLRNLVLSDETLTKKKLKEVSDTAATEIGLNKSPGDGVDLALFGRMTTDEAAAFTAVDASMQVAHPISTHEVIAETDWFTAVDDIKQEADEAGGAHLNETEFNSAVFYKYFSCNLPLLTENLRDDRAAALDALAAVYDAACRVGPTGKQNSFASHALADTALVVARGVRVPVSLANAFERPVRSERGGASSGFLAPSRERLVGHYKHLVEAYGLHDRAVLFVADPEARDALAADLPEGATVTGRLDDLVAFVREHGAEAPAEA